MSKWSLVAVLIIGVVASNAFARVYVDQNVPPGWPGAYPTIQEGVDAAVAAGDNEVWVARGVYAEERFNANGAVILAPNVRVYGGFAGGETSLSQRDWTANVTTIDGTTALGGDPAAFVVVGADMAVLDGFFVMGGATGLINAGWDSPLLMTVQNCTFEGLSGDAMINGRGLYPENVTAINCAFRNNLGNGIWNDGAQADVTITASQCLFSGNAGDGIATSDNIAATVTNCVFFANQNNGLSVGALSQASVVNSTFSFNAAAGAYCAPFHTESLLDVQNSVLWDDLSGEVVANDSVVAVTYSDVQGGFGVPDDNNIDQDPMFMDGISGDFRLLSGSPCIDTASAAGAPAVDIRGISRPQLAGLDMGAYEYAPPAADFNGSPTSGNAPLTVVFTDQSTAGGSPITAWAWTFGDGDASADPNPSHVYTNPGTYTVELTVMTDEGTSTKTKANYITVVVPPTANFSGTPASGIAPLNVQFNDLSVAGSAPIIMWAWDFGDGGTSGEQNPSHIYAAGGPYTVKLTVTTAVGSNTATKTDYITILVPPTADFSGAPTSGIAPLTVNFNDLSVAGSSPITAWAWDFGDGSGSAAQNPSHLYAAGGPYTVKLTVTTAVGSNTATKTDYITILVPPTANFSGTPASGVAPLTVNFNDLSVAGSSPITAWAWDFGDGSGSAAQNPGHIYAAGGPYTVKLTVTTAVGSNTATKTDYITILVPPTANFSGAPTSGVAPLLVNFNDLSVAGSSPITAWAWDFGDGSGSAAQNPSHIYATGGPYTVKLTVTTAVGSNSATKTSYITILVPPTADFSGAPTSGIAPLLVNFNDLSVAGSSPITAWAWDFGDGSGSAAQNPSHVYAAGGPYTVKLTVTTAVGNNTATKIGYITVQAPPVPPTANFSGTPVSGVAPLTVNFTDLSIAGTSPITAWAWDFGDGGVSAAQNPSHVYAAGGPYTVKLTVTTVVGNNTATKIGYITVQAPPVPPTANFSGTPVSGTAPLTVSFTDLSSAGSSPITAWAWQFGDGGTSTAKNPSHVYAAAGTYTVKLTVTTAVGSNAVTKTNYITVTSGGVKPTAAFSVTPYIGFKPLTVLCVDQSAPGSSPITKWLWSFGDGTTSTAKNPTHKYANSGLYTITLTVTNASGSSTATKVDWVLVVDPKKVTPLEWTLRWLRAHLA